MDLINNCAGRWILLVNFSTTISYRNEYASNCVSEDFEGMKSKNSDTIPSAAKVLWNHNRMISSSAMISTPWYTNSISAFQKKEIRAIKKAPNHPPENTTPPDPNKQNNVYFSIPSLGNWSTSLRRIRTHWLLFNMQTSLITPSGWYQNVCLLSCQGQFFTWAL